MDLNFSFLTLLTNSDVHSSKTGTLTCVRTLTDLLPRDATDRGCVRVGANESTTRYYSDLGYLTNKKKIEDKEQEKISYRTTANG